MGITTNIMAVTTINTKGITTSITVTIIIHMVGTDIGLAVITVTVCIPNFIAFHMFRWVPDTVIQSVVH